MSILIVKNKYTHSRVLHKLFVTCCYYNISVFFTSSSARCYFKNEEKKTFINRLRKWKIPQYQGVSKLKNAAVLVPLCNVNDEISLLFTLRRLDLKVHKGQVSFPGGKSDSMDSSLISTALRETEEELGIHRNNVDVWGHGNVISGREFNILPVVGYLGDIDLATLKPNPSEVESVFFIPLSHFYNKTNCRYTQFRNGHGYILPVYLNGKHNIWGITALITHLVLKSFSPEQYVHNLFLIKPVNTLDLH